MAISKWDLFKQIEEVPDDKYGEVKDYLDQLIKLNSSAEVMLDEVSKDKLKKSLIEYADDEYLSFDQVFEKGDDNV